MFDKKPAELIINYYFDNGNAIERVFPTSCRPYWSGMYTLQQTLNTCGLDQIVFPRFPSDEEAIDFIRKSLPLSSISVIANYHFNVKECANE